MPVLSYYNDPFLFGWDLHKILVYHEKNDRRLARYCSQWLFALVLVLTWSTCCQLRRLQLLCCLCSTIKHILLQADSWQQEQESRKCQNSTVSEFESVRMFLFLIQSGNGKCHEIWIVSETERVKNRKSDNLRFCRGSLQNLTFSALIDL